LACWLTSCGAYFNTFHNTKKYFNEAKKERAKRQGDIPTAAEQTKYNQTIEKASKILELYPNSKYVDDAVMILGECFYYKADYVAAARKFEELISYFPRSSYFASAQLWLGKTKIKLQDFAGARFILQELLTNPTFKKDLRDEGQFYLGEVQFEQGYFLEAEREYRKAAETASKKELKAAAYFQLGKSQIKIQDYPQAAASFRQAIKNSSDKRFTFDAELNLAIALKLASDFREATRILSKLLQDQSSKDRHGLVKLELADCLYRDGKSLQEKLKGANVEHLGKIEQALDEYKKILLEYKKTEVAAQASFEIARIYEQDYGDFASAKDYYEKVKLESTKSEYVPASIKKAKDIGDLIRLNAMVKKSQGLQLDRRKGAHLPQLSELELLLLEHGVHPELRFIQKKKKQGHLAMASQPQPKNDSVPPKSANGAQSDDEIDALVANKLQLAEIYLFQFSQIDSAMQEYNEIIKLFPNHPGCAKAIFSNALIYENQYRDKFKTDSLLYALINHFPDSYQAQEARKILGLPLVVNRNEIAADLYKSAEHHLFSTRNTSAAIAEFQKLYENFPKSEYAPKALFALGWIYEKMSHENEKAAAVYREIMQKYPDSEYSKKVKRKLDEVEKAEKQAELEKQKAAQAAAESATVTTKKADSTAAEVRLPTTESLGDSLQSAPRKAPIKEEIKPVTDQDRTKPEENKPVP
jgi:TolA-binding protein